MAGTENATLAELTARIRAEEQELAQGGGNSAVQRQHAKGRLTARERIERLVDR